MEFQPRPSYSYQDIGLVPLQESTVESRDEVHTRMLFLSVNLGFPLLSAPMESAVGNFMVRALEGAECLPVIPRRENPEKNAKQYVLNWGKSVVPSIPARQGREWYKNPGIGD